MARPDEAPIIIFSMLGGSKKTERKEILRDNGLFFRVPRGWRAIDVSAVPASLAA